MASGINLPQASLLPIQPAGVATPFGLHPSLVELQSSMAQAFDRFLADLKQQAVAAGVQPGV